MLMDKIRSVLGSGAPAASSSKIEVLLDESRDDLIRVLGELERLVEQRPAILFEGPAARVEEHEAKIRDLQVQHERGRLVVSELEKRLSAARSAEDAAAAEETVKAAEAAFQKARRLIEKDYLHHALAIAAIGKEIRGIQQQIRAANEIISREGLRPTQIPDPDLDNRVSYALGTLGMVRLPDPRKPEAKIWPEAGQ